MINKSLKHAFNIIFLSNTLTNLPQKTIYQLSELLHETYIFQIKKGKTVITQGQPADYIYILLSGEGLVLNDIDWNINNTIDEVTAIDCLGITEYLTKKREYTGFVIAKSDCYVLKVHNSEFYEILASSFDISFSILKILARVTTHAMEHAETQSTFPKKDIVGYYLYLKSCESIPYICPLKRSELADVLHINLRSLYRYLDTMELEGMIKLRKGKIIIDIECFKKLSHKYQSLIL